MNEYALTTSALPRRKRRALSLRLFLTNLIVVILVVVIRVIVVVVVVVVLLFSLASSSWISLISRPTSPSVSRELEHSSTASRPSSTRRENSKRSHCPGALDLREISSECFEVS